MKVKKEMQIEVPEEIKELNYRLFKELSANNKGVVMKTSIEMQLKIIDRMRSNIEGGNYLLDGIEYFSAFEEGWVKAISFKNSDFATYDHRLKPQTITINGVEIPKPLNDSEILGDVVYYCIDNSEFLYKQRKGQAIVDQGVMFAYEAKEEAIEASKLLFGIKE